jgi:uncharacterized protein YdiU (UPF0061 family)
MQTSILFNLDYSYLSLPDTFHSLVVPTSLDQPEPFLFNRQLADELTLNLLDSADAASILTQLGDFSQSYAQAYAGHQFGHFAKLGDGRAIMIGEHITIDKNRFDIQIKGSGRTTYSRGGDGRATLQAMLREYLISEAMHHLKISSSRSLAVIKTDEPVYRETIHQGAALIRVMKSHIRVGTFEYASYLGSNDDVKALTIYTIKRLYPEIELDENMAINLLKKVMIQQIELVVDWMRVGFIHGVMNTDNSAISGETFDYGPCAFMNLYNPNTVFSSIDQNRRYAFGNQPKIIKWNLACFAEALLPIIHEDKQKAIELAQEVIDDFDVIWNHKYYEMMLNKIGIKSSTSDHWELIDELLDLMTKHKMDYTNTFLALSDEVDLESNAVQSDFFSPWMEKRNRILDSLDSNDDAKQLMKENNPVFIPRNHLVEEALNQAINGDMTAYFELIDVLSRPYDYKNNRESFLKPSASTFEENYQTFCGT